MKSDKFLAQVANQEEWNQPISLFTLKEEYLKSNLNTLRDNLTALTPPSSIYKAEFVDPLPKGKSFLDTLNLLKSIEHLMKSVGTCTIGILPPELIEYQLFDNKSAGILTNSNKYPDINLVIGQQEFLESEPAKNVVRPGLIRQFGIELTEPLLRQLEVLSIDLMCLKGDHSPFGLEPEEFCQLLYYAGTSFNLKAIYIQSETVFNELESTILATGLWYFIKGFQFRLASNQPKEEDCYSFKVDTKVEDFYLTFYKEKAIDRWWVTFDQDDRWMPCSKLQYDQALKGNFPLDLSF